MDVDAIFHDNSFGYNLFWKKERLSHIERALANGDHCCEMFSGFAVNGLKHVNTPLWSFESLQTLNQRSVLFHETAQAAFTYIFLQHMVNTCFTS